MIPGKITSVYARTHSVINPLVDDYFNITLQFENGATAQTELGTFLLMEVPRWYMAGDLGTTVIDVPTHIAGVIDFVNGASGTIITSFDVYDANLLRIEIYSLLNFKLITLHTFCFYVL